MWASGYKLVTWRELPCLEWHNLFLDILIVAPSSGLKGHLGFDHFNMRLNLNLTRCQTTYSHVLNVCAQSLFQLSLYSPQRWFHAPSLQDDSLLLTDAYTATHKLSINFILLFFFSFCVSALQGHFTPNALIAALDGTPLFRTRQPVKIHTGICLCCFGACV